MNPRSGLSAGIASYVIWGFFPVYFVLLEGIDPAEVLSHRVFWAAVVLTVVIVATKQWAPLREAIRERRSRKALGLSAVFVGVMWFFYGYGVLTERALDVALGYFMCPVITVVLAVTVKGERPRMAQWVATGIGAVAIGVVTIGVGRFPWISCVIAIAFGLYGLAKNRLDRNVSATVGLAAETYFLLPVVCAVLVWLHTNNRASFAVDGFGATEFWLVLSGPVTLLPLFFFAVAAARLQLSILGNLQYLNPALQVLVGVLILQEEMPLARLVGFGLIWLALSVLMVDAIYNRARKQPPATGVQEVSRAIGSERPTSAQSEYR